MTGRSPETLVGWYVRALGNRGWQLLSADRRGAATSPRVVFDKSGRQLVFTSSLAPAANEHSAARRATSQYSLLLYPRGITPSA